MTVAIILYGSRARGDEHNKSDVDLLGIKADGNITFRREQGGVTLHEYPYGYLSQKAKSGDLFMLHITSEAVPISDDFNLLDNLKNQFKFKSNYVDEKNEAASIYWYCNNYGRDADEQKLRKRLTWVIRTLIIADAAEKRLPIFSSSDLERYSKILLLKDVIDNRYEVDFENLNSIAGELVSKYYEPIKPKKVSYNNVIRWMNTKGSMASTTPAYLDGKTRANFFQSFYT